MVVAEVECVVSATGEEVVVVIGLGGTEGRSTVLVFAACKDDVEVREYDVTGSSGIFGSSSDLWVPIGLKGRRNVPLLGFGVMPSESHSKL